jgi:hypothetical protein
MNKLVLALALTLALGISSNALGATNCKDLIFAQPTAYSCDLKGSDASISPGVPLVFEPDGANPTGSKFVAKYGSDEVEFFCACKVRGTVARPTFGSSAEFSCNVKSPISGFVESFSGKVAGKDGIKIKNLQKIVTHLVLDSLTEIGQCQR